MELIHLDTPKDFDQHGISVDDIVSMYIRYLNALVPYNKELQKPDFNAQKIAEAEVFGALYRDDTDVVAFTKNDCFPPILGLSFIGQKPNAYSDGDIYIQEFYIDIPGEGYGKEAAGCIVENYPGKDISLFILKDNHKAKVFWNTVLTSQSYKELVVTGEITPPPTEMFEPTLAETIFQYWRKY